MTRSYAILTRTALAICTIAGLAPVHVAAQDDPMPTPAMEYRQSIMGGIGAHRGALTAILSEDVPHQGHVLGHALSLQQLSVMASDIFPEGSHGEGSRALPDIWEDAAGFGEALSAFQAAAGGLAEAARGGDMAAVDEAAAGLGRTCGGCHRPYRARAAG